MPIRIAACGAKVVSSSESGVEALGYGGVEDQFPAAELRGDLSERRARDGHAEDGAGGGADDLRVPRVDGVGREEDLLRAEGFGGADEGAEVAGVLEAFEDESDGLRLRRMAAGVSGMRMVAAMPCGEAVSTALAKTSRLRMRVSARFDCGECGAVENVLAAFAEEEGFEGRPERMASAIRCSPSRPRRSPGCAGLPLKEARRALTRALDLLVMGAGAGMRRRRVALKPSVRAESPMIARSGLR